jgi:hypothetical protein
MKEKIKKYWWAIIIVLFIGGSFYWFQWRPSIIRKDCYDTAREEAIKKLDREDKKFNGDDYDTYYKWCLEKNGLK